MSDDWADSPELVVREQLPIRVFINTNGDIAIVQRAYGDHEEDQIVTVTLEKAPAVINAMSALLVRGTADND